MDEVGYAFGRGLLLGAVFGGATFGAAAVGINAVVAGSGLGASEGALEAWVTGGNPLSGALVGGLLGGVLSVAGPALTKSIGRQLKGLADRIAASAPLPNPAALASTMGQAVSDWTIQKGGFRLSKIGGFWIKEIDPAQVGLAAYAEGAIKAQVEGLKRLGNLAPEFLYQNGRLVIRDVGKFEGPLFEMLQIKVLGSIRLGTLFNDIWSRNIGANGQVFDPVLHPVHEALIGVSIALGSTVSYLHGWSGLQGK